MLAVPRETDITMLSCTLSGSLEDLFHLFFLFFHCQTRQLPFRKFAPSYRFLAGKTSFAMSTTALKRSQASPWTPKARTTNGIVPNDLGRRPPHIEMLVLPNTRAAWRGRRCVRLP